MIGSMAEPLRPDKFTVSPDSEPVEGLFVLRKDKDASLRILPAIRLQGFSGTSVQINTTHNSGIISATFPEHAEPYVNDGDVIALRKKSVRIILSNIANANTLLLTERCNNRCLFCSQPPKDIEDSYLYVDATQALVEFNTGKVVGLSGGEPFLDPQRTFSMLTALDSANVVTPLHILTNGRAFSEVKYVKQLEELSAKREIVLGIPLYATNPELHDELVGADGAWRETIEGLINLSHSKVPVELRFIPTSPNLEEIDKILPFANRFFGKYFVFSVMNLEPTGWARQNWDQLFVSPSEYQEKLQIFRQQAEQLRLNVRLFNYPLCHLEPSLRDIATKSISDWKNAFHSECDICRLKKSCSGYFTSSTGKFIDPPRRIE
jgi:His-Xaa-Ser system radical SAM maturase HxsC